MESHTVETPLGTLALVATGGRLSEVTWLDSRSVASPLVASEVLREAERQVRAYFEGRLTRFDLPLAPAPTPFQGRVRAALCAIPFAQTASYGRVAARIGGAPRAVGGACGRNPLPIVVPCHRVVGANGTLTGFSGGRGLDTKAALLQLEQRIATAGGRAP